MKKLRYGEVVIIVQKKLIDMSIEDIYREIDMRKAPLEEIIKEIKSKPFGTIDHDELEHAIQATYDVAALGHEINDLNKYLGENFWPLTEEFRTLLIKNNYKPQENNE